MSIVVTTSMVSNELVGHAKLVGHSELRSGDIGQTKCKNKF